VWVCPKGAFEVASGSSPELSGEDWFRATSPIVKWEPDVLLR
jgi:hypothetical protein